MKAYAVRLLFMGQECALTAHSARTWSKSAKIPCTAGLCARLWHWQNNKRGF